MSAREVRIGLLGCGTVGRGVVELVARNTDAIAARTGLRPRIEKILVRDRSLSRGVDSALLTDRPEDVVRNGVDVVVEALGGDEPACSLLTEALERGKPVVTANKLVLASHHDRLLTLADRRRRAFGYEACVCAGVPVVRSLRHALAADRLTSFEGVLNGTTNFILSRMEEGDPYAEALIEARRRGFAESDPTNDVEGIDAALKTAILCGTAFGATIPPDRIPREGMTKVTAADLAAVRRWGYTIRLIARAELDDCGDIRASVGPELIPQGAAAARVRDEENVLIVHGQSSGDLIFQGRGAGGGPTASALLSDVLDAAAKPDTPAPRWRTVKPAPARPTARYLRITCAAPRALPRRWLDGLTGQGVEVRRIEVARCPEDERLRTVRALTEPCEDDIVDRIAALGAPEDNLIALRVQNPARKS
ncbi:MAG: Homoserine dehydrogenase [Phycisphaerae bacterium]|nr:Homoserine dehydrogenase [Phycisphaerae bacterium]